VTRIARRVLDNGLTVVAEERGLGPVVFSGVVYNVGSRDERPGLTGISHLLEHMMFKTTEKYAKGEVSAIVERNGGELNAFTTEDVTMYYESFAADRWELALEIEAERMVNLTVDPGELESERQVVLEERAMYLDMPAVELSEELTAAAFRESPYRWPIIGWEGDIRAITREDMLDYYGRFYSPGNAALVVVGDVEPDDVFAAAERRFGAVAPAPPVERRVPKEPPLRGVTRVELRRQVQLPQIQMLFRGPEMGTPESEALFLLTTVLSGSKTSRLDLALIETHKAGDVQVQYYAKADPGSCVIAVEGQPGGSLDELEDVVRAEIGRLRDGEVAPDELERALNQAEAHHVFAQQSPSARGSILAWHEAHGDVEYADAVVGRLRALAPADLQRVAKEWLDPEACAVARLVPDGRNGHGGGNGAGTSSSAHGVGIPAGPSLHGVHCPRRRFRTGVAAGPGVARRKLANGLTVMLQPDRTDPVVSVSLLFEAGAAADPDGREGLAALAADTLERGTASLDFVEFSRRFERIGSDLSVGAGAELAHVDATFLTRHAGAGLGLIADVLEEPGFREDDFRTVRSLARNDLEAREDDLDDVAEELFFRAVAAGHPYAKLAHGTREGVDAATLEEAKAFHAARYRPDRAFLSVVGDYDEAALERMLEERFGRLPNPPAAPARVPPLPETVAETVLVKTRTDKAQAKIFLGGPGISAADPDRLAAVMANHILGGSAIRSRLGDEIRDNRGLAYSVYSRNVHRSRGGVFLVHLGTRPENVRGAVEAIRAEIARLGGSLTPQELQDARDYLTGSFPLRFTTYGRLARYWTRSAFYGWPEDSLRTYADRVRALTAADLARAAERLAAGARVLAVAGPVGPDLAPVGDG
jgi:zinc protease